MVDTSLIRMGYNILRHIPENIHQTIYPTSLKKILKINGWTKKEQLEYLQRQVSGLADGSAIVEIGVWQGRSAIAMADVCRGTKKKIYAIDPWSDYVQNGRKIADIMHIWGATSFESNYQAFLGNCKKFDVESVIVPVRASSLDAAREWAGGRVSMLFVDGNHDYPAVVADLEAWSPLVEPGGLICGDDWAWDSVRAAVTDFASRFPSCDLYSPCENTWVLAVQGRCVG